MKYRKRTTVDAEQWFQHGDHEEVTRVPSNAKLSVSRREKVGWLDTAEGGHVVFPGDWVICDHKGRWSTCNPVTFNRLYEPAEDFDQDPPGNTRAA